MAYIVIPIEMGDITKIIPCVEKVQHYEAQIKTITEDFNLEREARAQAHEKIDDLQEEVARLKSLIEKQRQAIKDATATKRYRTPRYECDCSDEGVFDDL